MVGEALSLRLQKILRKPGVIFVLPAVFLIILIIGYPFVYAIWTSFTDKTVANPFPNFVGLLNYLRWIRRPDFWRTFFNTLIYAGGTMVPSLLFGFGIGLSLFKFKKRENIYGALILLPWIIPTVISTLIWFWMFNPYAGVLNYLFLNLRLISQPINWLGDPILAMVSVIGVSVWRNSPYFGMLIFSGRKQIPDELYEASEMDGATPFQQFRYITFPALIKLISFASMLIFARTAYDFAIVYILTRGGPSGATDVLSVKAFVTAFDTGQLGLGIALPLLAFPLFAPLMLLASQGMVRGLVGGSKQ
jgi:multiple sugar transport system permease protein